MCASRNFESNWRKMVYVYYLYAVFRKKRFSELERTIPHINTRMLVKELKNLVQNGVIAREIFATVPPTVEYSLTEKGEKLESIINDIYNWGVEHLD